MKDIFSRNYTLVAGDPMTPRPEDMIAISGWITNGEITPTGFRVMRIGQYTTLVAGIMYRKDIERFL